MCVMVRCGGVNYKVARMRYAFKALFQGARHAQDAQDVSGSNGCEDLTMKQRSNLANVKESAWTVERGMSW